MTPDERLRGLRAAIAQWNRATFFTGEQCHRVGYRQWLALQLLAHADGGPVVARRLAEAAYGDRWHLLGRPAVQGLLTAGLVRHVDGWAAVDDWDTARLVITEAGWSARLNGRGRRTASEQI